MPWALFGFVLSVSTLVAVWLMRDRIKAYLGQAILEGVRSWAFVQETAEDGTPVTRPSPEAVAMLHLYAPVLVTTVLKVLQKRGPKDSPPIVREGGQLDLGAALGLLPKRYQGLAALALQFLPGLVKGGGRASEKETKNPFLQP